MFAAWEGNAEAVEALLQCRADVHEREERSHSKYGVVRGDVPLHHASFLSADVGVVNVLLRYRADVEATAFGGIVPLMAAAYGGREHAVAALLRARASVSARDPMGTTPLHVATLMGRADVCAQLIAARASAAPDKNGISPLVYAAFAGGGRPTVEAILTAADADSEARINLKALNPLVLLLTLLGAPRRLWGSRSIYAILGCEAQGMTPLMIAGVMGSVGEAQALVAARADVAARNSRGRTAAELAELVGLLPTAVACFRDRMGADAHERWEPDKEARARSALNQVAGAHTSDARAGEQLAALVDSLPSGCVADLGAEDFN